MEKKKRAEIILGIFLMAVTFIINVVLPVFAGIPFGFFSIAGLSLLAVIIILILINLWDRLQKKQTNRLLYLIIPCYDVFNGGWFTKEIFGDMGWKRTGQR